MTVRTLLFIEFQVLVIVIIVGLFVWRYWYQPRQLDAQRRAQIAEVVPQPEIAKKEATVPTSAQVPSVRVSGINDVGTATVERTRVVRTSPGRGGVESLLKNGDFSSGIANWTFWRDAKLYPYLIKVVKVPGPTGVRNVLRIENPDKRQVGVQQLARVVSGGVYRLSAAVRSLAGHDTNTLFGGRVAFYLQPQKEFEIVWMTEYNQWWRRELIFTNVVDGVATVYAHLGYGNVATTGEFTDIVLERLQ
ncbi:MAG: hypothetical protein N2595_05625 [bacterium]|nr:hypothetical protein [bacterium]